MAEGGMFAPDEKGYISAQIDLHCTAHKIFLTRFAVGLIHLEAKEFCTLLTVGPEQKGL
jgi:hypothetical protein